MKPLTNEQVVKLLPALAEAARADQHTAQRFVAPRTGILEETASRHHQFVFGRRGVGKSTLLRKIESLGPNGHGDVIFVDIETLRGRPYPDVLIELLIEVLRSLEGRLKAKAGRVDFHLSRRRARKELRNLTKTMRRLLHEPQVAERIIKDLQSSSRTTGAGFGLDGKIKRIISAKARAEYKKERSREESREARVEESKMDGLLSAAVLIRGAFANAQKHLNDGATLVVLDDFYHVPYEHQPDVLAYLHQIVKNLGIYLKICGVRHRIQPFVDGDPPRGLQPGQDAGEVSLDITLERFTTAQTFLEQILTGICSPLGIEVEDLLSEGGRPRLVLGSGGVARDYLYLTQKALRNANEREENPSRLTIASARRMSTRRPPSSPHRSSRTYVSMRARMRTSSDSDWMTSSSSASTSTTRTSSWLRGRSSRRKSGAKRFRPWRTFASFTRSGTCPFRLARIVGGGSSASRST